MLIVYMLISNLLIRFFSVKRVANYCRISQIPVLVFFFQSGLLQTLEADLVRTNNKLGEAEGTLKKSVVCAH